MAQESASTVIGAPLDTVWEVFTDIRAAADRLTGVRKIEVLNGEHFAVGYRWRETRRMFGQDATEDMWVTALADEGFYEVAAESHGTKYLSRYDFTQVGPGVRVDVVFSGEPVSTTAKVMSMLTGWIAGRSVRKMLQQDLDELAAVCEQR